MRKKEGKKTHLNEFIQESPIGSACTTWTDGSRLGREPGPAWPTMGVITRGWWPASADYTRGGSGRRARWIIHYGAGPPPLREKDQPHDEPLGLPGHLGKLERYCEEQGVLVLRVNPTYTSQSKIISSYDF